MAKFAYNNVKNVSISYTLFEFSYKYYSQIFFQEKANQIQKFELAKKLIKELKEVMFVDLLTKFTPCLKIIKESIK